MVIPTANGNSHNIMNTMLKLIVPDKFPSDNLNGALSHSFPMACISLSFRHCGAVGRKMNHRMADFESDIMAMIGDPPLLIILHDNIVTKIPCTPDRNTFIECTHKPLFPLHYYILTSNHLFRLDRTWRIMGSLVWTSRNNFNGTAIKPAQLHFRGLMGRLHIRYT